MIGPPDMDKTFSLSQAEIAVFDREVYDLIIDIETLHDMAKVGVLATYITRGIIECMTSTYTCTRVTISIMQFMSSS